LPGGFVPAILCYHAVTDEWRDLLSVGLPKLERQVRLFLRLGYRPAPLEEVLASGGRQLHVTFDDAFANVIDALPVLDRLGVPATVFACSGYADDGRPLDIPELRAREQAPATMTWDDLRTVAERGVTLGSHTVSHPHLPELADDELDRELRESRERLADELGRPCRYLAYPFGDEDERVRSASRRAGYDAAFALPGADRPWDRFAVPRIGIYRADRLPHVLLKSSPFLRRVASQGTI
jgi:peptidoglycan/xylan/chitin deacetylase (PgdA/CDA1 family)